MQLDGSKLTTALLDASPEVILLLDRDARILFANRVFLERFGISAAEAAGTRVTDRLPPEVAQRRLAAIRQTADNGEPLVINDERDGRHFETQFCPVADEDGEVQCIAVYTRETTEVVIAQRALAESEARLQVITQKLPLPIWVSSLADGRVLVANEALHTLLDLPQGSLIGSHTPDLYEDAAQRDELLAALRADGRVHNREVPIRLPDGRRRVIWASAELAEVAGEAVMMGCFVDVTERREAEARLREMGRMDAVGRLAGGIAHDFNNMLTAIQGYTGLVRSTLDEGDTRLGDLEQINSAAARAGGLTKQLVAYSRRQVLKPAAVDLNAAVEEMTNLLGRVIGEHVELATRFARTVGPVWVDPTQLQQVLMNLVLNARDAMPNGGTITVSTEVLAAGDPGVPQGMRDAGCVMLSVSDSGSGMDEETRSRVFEPFFTTKELGHGAGLGLATVQGIVQQSGGDIDVSSVPGEGSTFRVFLQGAQSPPQPAQPSSDIAPGTAPSATVLVVEDESAVRDLVMRTLGRAGYDVLCADTGEQALELAADHGDSIDLLLTDIVMRGIDGPTLAQRLREQRPDMRVLFMSGYSDVLREQHVGVPLLEKPFDTTRLERAVRRALE